MLEWLLNLKGETIFAFLSALAAVAAAVTAWFGPAAAAKLAEQMRRDNDGHDEKRRTKLHIFTTLMQWRGIMHDQEAVRAFNLIDVVFIDSRKVRDAWAHFFALLNQKSYSEYELRKLLSELLAAMATDLKIGELRLDDFERVYYPVTLEKEQLMKTLQRESIIQTLSGKISLSANSTPTRIISPEFPPAPVKQ
jgi:hypothetical protein